MKRFKVLAVFLAAVLLMIGALTACGSGKDEDTDTKERGSLDFWEVTSEMSFDEAYKLEERNFKIAKSLEPLYESETYLAYKDAISEMEKNNNMESVNAAIAAREGLVQTSNIEDRVLFLWGDEAPVLDGETYTEEDLDSSFEESYGSRPFIIKSLLDDPSKAKGNLVIVSGGGMERRSNQSEGYPALDVFNDLGYNVFLLQRRVAPYSDMDIFMDYQRAVKTVRYYAEKEGYGGADMIAGIGWSGGGFTIMGAIDNCYGTLDPTDLGASDYVPDEIDAVNSDLDVAMIIYGSDGNIGTANPNLPAFYICAGTEDKMVDPNGSRLLYDNVKDKVPALLNMIEGAPHSFGVGTVPILNGQVPAGAELWPAQAAEFMQQNIGHSGN